MNNHAIIAAALLSCVGNDSRTMATAVIAALASHGRKIVPIAATDEQRAEGRLALHNTHFDQAPHLACYNAMIEAAP